MFTPANLFGALLFGAIGMGAFVYGKKAPSVKAIVIGVLLMIYPYFIHETWLLYLVGCGLTGSLFIFRE